MQEQLLQSNMKYFVSKIIVHHGEGFVLLRGAGGSVPTSQSDP